MPSIRDHDASVYLKMLGDELHIGGYENNPIFIEKVIPFTVLINSLSFINSRKFYLL